MKGRTEHIAWMTAKAASLARSSWEYPSRPWDISAHTLWLARNTGEAVNSTA